MNTLPKTPRRFSDERTGVWRAGWVAVALAAAALSLGQVAMARPTAASGDAPALRCSLQLPAVAQSGSPVMLQMTLANTGAQALRVLNWNTPFEGAWLGASVQVWHQGRQVPYQGPSVKRGAPLAVDYLEIAPGSHREASLDLGLVFDLSRVGSYELRPQFRLHDVQPAHVAVPLNCPTLRFKLASKP